jgi:hypothetical protein
MEHRYACRVVMPTQSASSNAWNCIGRLVTLVDRAMPFFGYKTSQRPVNSGYSLRITIPCCNILCDHLNNPSEAEINTFNTLGNFKGTLHVNYRGWNEKRKVAASLSIFGVRQK